MIVNREKVTVTIDKKVIKELREYSKESMIPISRLVDHAIQKLLEETKKER